MTTLGSAITDILPQISKRVEKQLTHLGIRTTKDLLFYFPYRHEDYRVITPIGKLGELAEGNRAAISARVDLIRTFRSAKRHMLITDAVVSDPSGSTKITWFHQPYVGKTLPIGTRAFFVGRVTGKHGHEFINPSFEKILGSPSTGFGNIGRDAGRIVPVYRTTEGLTQKMLRALVRKALPAATTLPEWLANGVIGENGLLGFAQAVVAIHFPADEKVLKRSRDRLAFDELFLFQARAFEAASHWKRQQAPVVRFDEPATKTYVKALPFRLTDAQRKAAWEILGDIGKEHPMNRLLHGDVGSGKTVTASIAMFNVARSGGQAALLCPTEILANQHFETLKAFFAASEIPIALLTAHAVKLGSRRVLKNTVLKRLRSGELPIVVGTHALLQPPVLMPKLALAIIDEQHRFGVEQRKALSERRGDAVVPHILTMTATPIPRTLGLTLYSDMDLSVLDAMPTHRAGVLTKVLRADERAKAEEHIRKEIAASHGVFVLCPRIEVEEEAGETLFDWEGSRSVKAESQRLATVFSGARIGMLHGKMKSEKKEEVMEQFSNGDLDILVSTSVVEVGIDVARATIMLVENAEMFGLAQLHQLRGRVGRAELPGFCYLIVGTADEQARERVAALEQLTDGFALAERDLELRGPSHLWGSEQSGWPKFKVADLYDKAMVERTHRAVKKLFREDPTLSKWPRIKAAVMRRARGLT